MAALEVSNSAGVTKVIEDIEKRRAMSYKMIQDKANIPLKLLAEFVCDDDNGLKSEDIESFKKDIEELAKSSAENELSVDAFISVMQTFKDRNFDEPDEINEKEILESAKRETENGMLQGDYKRQKSYKTIMDIIKDKDDDDIALVNQGGSRNLHCPITGVLFDVPVKSISCGHIYEKAAIRHHIKVKVKGSRLAHCPIPGCAKKVTMQELEDDQETVLLVKRYKRELETQRDIGDDAEDLTQAL